MVHYDSTDFAAEPVKYSFINDVFDDFRTTGQC
jgi:hypothetical protein